MFQSKRRGEKQIDRIVVEGGRPLNGIIHISGAKNAVLPLIAASLLVEGDCRIDEAPYLSDVKTMCDVLDYLGVGTYYENSCLYIDAAKLRGIEAPAEYVNRMRASCLIMGPLLARLGRVRLSLPGGCKIGKRPIDLHLKGFEAMGANITIGNGFIDASVNGLHGSRIYLDFPSVGATENLMMAATLAQGHTIIENAAEEPEIVDLANFLSAMGGKIKGAGTNVIRIEGVESLHSAEHVVIPDRIEAGSFMMAAAVTGGEVVLENVITEHLKSVIAKLSEAGVEVIDEIDGLRVRSSGELVPLDIKTLPYPGFPTDMQAQFMAALSLAHGNSTITETVFENRFMHIEELRKMGANIQTDGATALISGVPRLYGSNVRVTDLRAGAAMVIAGLAAHGTTYIYDVEHIARGYDNLVSKLNQVGAAIRSE